MPRRLQSTCHSSTKAELAITAIYSFSHTTPDVQQKLPQSKLFVRLYKISYSEIVRNVAVIEWLSPFWFPFTAENSIVTSLSCLQDSHYQSNPELVLERTGTK